MANRLERFRIKHEVVEEVNALLMELSWYNSEEGQNKAIEHCEGFNKPGNAAAWTQKGIVEAILERVKARGDSPKKFLQMVALGFAMQNDDEVRLELMPFYEELVAPAETKSRR